MSIYTDVQNKITESRLARDTDKLEIYILIKGELDRVMTMQDGRKIVWDTEALKIITRMKKSLDELEASGAVPDVECRVILEAFLPEQLSRESITEWINDNINLEDYKNKMQAMGTIMQALGSNGADGNTVKEILMEM